MPIIEVSHSTVVVRLSAFEQLLGWRRRIVIARAAIVDCEVVDRPLAQVEGLRAPGTAVPGLIAYGTFRRRERKAFVAVRRGAPAVRITLRAHEFSSLLISVVGPARLCAQLGRPPTRGWSSPGFVGT
jgi:hypothetical protein